MQYEEEMSLQIHIAHESLAPSTGRSFEGGTWGNCVILNKKNASVKSFVTSGS